MKKIFKIADIRKLEQQVSNGKISYSRMVEIMNEMANNAECKVEKLPIPVIISRLLAMKNGEDLPEFDHSKANDTTYCVEWGVKKGEWITDGIIDRYIEELNGL